MALHPTPGPGLPDPDISPFFGTEAAADAIRGSELPQAGVRP